MKRRLEYKSSALSLNVRPHKVLQAAAWLANNSSLYREQDVTIDPYWVNHYSDSIDLGAERYSEHDSWNTDLQLNNDTNDHRWLD